MKKYTLLLDESGNFKESAKNTEPSIVAGLLLEDKKIDELWAKSCLKKVKESNLDYSSISILPFHAMEEKSPHKYNFITDLLCILAKGGARVVSFVNQKGIVIVNSDITYLNVFSNGIISLIRDLLKNTNEEISLSIFYAHREEDIAREELNLRTRISQEEYEKRLEERLDLFIAKLPTFDRKRFDQRILWQTDNAKKNSLLMLADAVCFALRGGKASFNSEQNERIRELPHLSYIVPEKESWVMIQDAMAQNHYAEAIFLWYGGLKTDLRKNEKDFQKIIVQYFMSSDDTERDVITTILSQYLQQLIRQRHYDVANQYMECMETDFIPLMHKNGINLERLSFDLHFSRLTTATHQGDCQTGEKEIALCRKGLKKFPVTYETLDYYLRYKLREVEHLKNCFDFHQALLELNSLENILSSMVELVHMIDELGDYAKGITSNTLGSVYGSRIITRCFLGITEPEQFEFAREDYKCAINQFSKYSDQRRDYQSRSAVEYCSGHYEEALSYLSLSFMDDESTNAKKVLKAILNDKPGTNRLFGMMHYASIMARAMLEDNPLGTVMFEEWRSNDNDFDRGGDGYPVSIILWRLATCAALKKLHSAQGWYNRAIAVSMRDLDAQTSVIIGLTMQIERLALIPFKTEEYLRRLKKDYEMFISSNIPNSMQSYISPWKKIIFALQRDNIKKYKKELLNLTARMPIL